MQTTTVSVNGTIIPDGAIAAEMQHHPASTPTAARAAATEALVVRELLLQEARQKVEEPTPLSDRDGRRETKEEALIRQLLEREIEVPEADDQTCRSWYERNRNRFRSSDLFEAAHILFAASPEDETRYTEATRRAEAAIALLTQQPEQFSELAREMSDCPSATNGGSLGQVAKGGTVPEFETFLFNLQEGQLCPVPVKTRYGVHVLRLDRRIAGRQLPFELVRNRIAEYLNEQVWRRAVAQYIRILAGRAEITGIDFARSDSPLVQ